MNSQTPLTPNAIVQMASAYYESATLFAAIESGVFACLHARRDPRRWRERSEADL